MAVFGVPGRFAVPLPEPLKFFHGKVVAREMKEGVYQGRTVTGG
jgi:hypothetical protein